MYSMCFRVYDANAEEFGKDYWQFLDASEEELKANDIYLDFIGKIINEISNEELKIKMKKKVLDLILNNGIFFLGLERSLNVFSSDEVKKIIEQEFNNKIVNYLLDEENIIYRTSDIFSFIKCLKSSNDDNWEYFIIKKILDTIKDYKSKVMFVNIIEYYKYNEALFNKLIGEYYSYLPDSYKNFLQMQKDPEYINKKSLQFMNEDIGIDPRISIGPEIEANNDYYIRIDLYNQKGYDDYSVHSDATVPNGSEIASRSPFHNTKEEVAKFCGLCEALKDIGYYYDETSQNAAGQINLGLDYLDTKESILNFYEIYCSCEELLYYISNGEGQLFRQDVYSSSRIKPISAIIGKRVLDEELSREEVIKLFNNTHYGNDGAISGLKYKKNSVCLRGTNEKDYRLEFRIPNGGCNYRIWLDNIRLFGKMMEVAKRISDIMKKDYISKEEEELLTLKFELQDGSISLEEKLDILVNLLFKDDDIKQIYYDRFLSTKKRIIETNSLKYKRSYGEYEPGFDEVEFEEQYFSRLDPDYSGKGVIEYDPEYGIIDHGIKK